MIWGQKEHVDNPVSLGLHLKVSQLADLHLFMWAFSDSNSLLASASIV